MPDNDDLKILQQGLEEADEIFHRKQEDFSAVPDALHWKREGAVRALVVVLDFLKRQIPGAPREPLRDTIGMIADVDEGCENSMLVTRPRKKGSPKSSIVYEMKMAHASKLIDHYWRDMISDGHNMREVAQMVAHEMQIGGLAKTAGKTEITPADQLLNFRKQLRRGKKSKRAKAFYDNFDSTMKKE